MQGMWVSLENSFSERLWVQESMDGVILTMVEQGYGPSVAKEWVKAQGCGCYRDNMWVLDPPSGGYPGKFVFRETLGENVPVGPRIE